jgi:hypothetical protein
MAQVALKMAVAPGAGAVAAHRMGRDVAVAVHLLADMHRVTGADPAATGFLETSPNYLFLLDSLEVVVLIDLIACLGCKLQVCVLSPVSVFA